MDRIAQGLSATLSHTFFSDGTPTNPSPDAATVTITRDDGTTVVTDATVTNTGVGMVTFTLTPAQTALLDVLTVSWTASFGGQSQTFKSRVEVAGGFLFTIAELRAESTQLASTTNYPTSKVTSMRTTVESALESRLGYALVPRYTREKISGTRHILGKPYVRALRSVITNGAAIAAPELAALTYSDVVLAGYANGTVAYEHGRDNDDPEAGQAALMLAKAWIISGPVDDRALGFANESGGSFGLDTPGRNGSFFGLPAVNEWVGYNRLPSVA